VNLNNESSLKTHLNQMVLTPEQALDSIPQQAAGN